MMKLNNYLTKDREDVTWKDRVADAAGIVIIAGMAALVFMFRHGML